MALLERAFQIEPFETLEEHLGLELEMLNLRLKRQVMRLRARHRFKDDPFRGLCIRDEEVDLLLADGVAAETAALDSVAALSAELRALLAYRASRLAATREAGLALPLTALAERFALSPLESQLLIVALAPEIDLAYETLYGYVQNDVTRRRPTVALACELFAPEEGEPLALRALFAPERPLRRERLLKLVEDAQEREGPIAGRYLKLEDSIAAFLLGTPSLEEKLLELSELPAQVSNLGRLALSGATLRELRAAGAAAEHGGLIALAGPAGSDHRAAAAALAAELGRPLLTFDVTGALRSAEPFATLLALALREARLHGAALLGEGFDAVLSEDQRAGLAAFEHAVGRATFPVLVSLQGAWDPAELTLELPTCRITCGVPDAPERALLWRNALGHEGTGLSREVLGTVAERFALAPREIRAAARRAGFLAAARGAAQSPSATDLHAGARAVGRAGLGRLAQKLEGRHTFEDLVLPRRAFQGLRDLSASLAHRERVHGAWGFGARLGLTPGISALFAGASGTGKTMAAGILARELGVDAYRVDLSAVVNKYIGETEKNLAKVFDEAERSHALLFFDEADALFGKRSEVKDAHDRHANIEVSYLLQRLESSSAIVILATNFKANLDDAFARRLAHVIDFPFPDREHRERLWRRMFPSEAPLAGDVDFEFLARQFELAGGNIKNVALAAAFLAADEGGEIAMRHLIVATARELQKIGRLPTKSEFREHYDLIRERGL